MAERKTLYLKLERCVETQKTVIRLGDLGKLVCADSGILEKAKTVKICSFSDRHQKRCVISVMRILEELQKLQPSVEVQNIGETEVIVERAAEKERGLLAWLKTAFVCLICFFGPAFTIMAFHNDIGIGNVFGKIYEMATGRAADGVTILEISYSIGLAAGIILFFNHVGGRRITKDPTPIEVEMRIYEDQVNSALVENADRKGEMIDAS